MHNGYTVVVTLGRMVGDTPMHIEQWKSFQRKIMADLTNVGTVIQKPEQYFAGQVGVWDGQEEDAACFIALVPNSLLVGKLRDKLKQEARLYKQKAIGYIVVEGTDNLVYPQEKGQ